MCCNLVFGAPLLKCPIETCRRGAEGHVEGGAVVGAPRLPECCGSRCRYATEVLALAADLLIVCHSLHDILPWLSTAATDWSFFSYDYLQHPSGIPAAARLIPSTLATRTQRCTRPTTGRRRFLLPGAFVQHLTGCWHMCCTASVMSSHKLWQDPTTCQTQA